MIEDDDRGYKPKSFWRSHPKESLCPSCGLPAEYQPCDEKGTITPCFDAFHNNKKEA